MLGTEKRRNFAWYIIDLMEQYNADKGDEIPPAYHELMGVYNSLAMMDAQIALESDEGGYTGFMLDYIHYTLRKADIWDDGVWYEENRALVDAEDEERIYYEFDEVTEDELDDTNEYEEIYIEVLDEAAVEALTNNEIEAIPLSDGRVPYFDENKNLCLK